MLADTVGHTQAVYLQHVDQVLAGLLGFYYVLRLIQPRQFPGRNITPLFFDALGAQFPIVFFT